MEFFKTHIENNDAKVLIAFSGGKDSIAMYLYVRFVLNIPNSKIELHHHEVDGHGENFFDWPCTTSYCTAFAQAFDVPIFYSYRAGGIKREMLRNNETLQSVFYQLNPGGPFTEIKSLDKQEYKTTREMFPAVSADLRTRWCSVIAKIDVLSRVITNNPNYKTGNYVLCTGERREESPTRSKYKEVEPYRASTKKRDVILWRPIIDWPEKQVWEIIQKHNVQPHPAYVLGWSRCSCMTCIFNSSNTWASLNHIHPKRINQIASLEEQINHTLYKGETIHNKTQKGKSFIDIGDYWISQALGTFTAPIIVSNWVLPQGAKSKEVAGAN